MRDVTTTQKILEGDFFKYCQRSLGDKFKYKAIRDSIFFYRKEYEPVIDKHEFKSYEGYIREDASLSPEAILMKYDKISENYPQVSTKSLFYIDRECTGTEYIMVADKLPEYERLHRRRFKNIKFEKMFALELTHPLESRMFHTFSGGIDLFGINDKFPDNLKEEIQLVLAKAFRELHKNGIEYNDPLPNNMRYNFDEKLILFPHNCMDFGRKDAVYNKKGLKWVGHWKNDVRIKRDLAIIAYTNPWIKNYDEFISQYLGDEETESLHRWLRGGLAEEMNVFDDIDCDATFPTRCWMREVTKSKYGRLIRRKTYF